MDTFQLRYILSKTLKNITFGVCASDELYKVATKEFALIVNVAPSSEPGLHWVSFFKSPAMKAVEFFDSSGNCFEHYGTSIRNFTDQFHTVKECTSRLQPLDSNKCGLYCLMFLIKRYNGISYSKFLRVFTTTNLKENDLIVESEFKNVKYPKFASCYDFCKMQCDHDNISSFCIQKNKICLYVVQSKHE